MTGDAQAEAERIVGEIVANETAVLPWVKDIDAWHEHQERVVAALAAAIEVGEADDVARQALASNGGQADLADSVSAFTASVARLKDALSALRSGEET